jgi:glutathione S-transferase
MSGVRIRLYGNAHTPYTEKVIRALQFKHLPFELVEPSSPEDYRRWSPETGLLPVMDLDEQRIADSAVILDVLDERFPEPPLESRDPRLARDQRRLEQWVGETFGYYLIRWVKMRARALGIEPNAPTPTGGPLMSLGLVGEDGRLRPEVYDTEDGGPGPEFERRLDDLAVLLGDRRYFHGDRLSRADLAVFGALHPLWIGRFAGARELLESRPNLRDHTLRVDAETAAA